MYIKNRLNVREEFSGTEPLGLILVWQLNFNTFGAVSALFYSLFTVTHLLQYYNHIKEEVETALTLYQCCDIISSMLFG